MEKMCPHCKTKTFAGTYNGCAKCGKVKHTESGRRQKKGQ